MKQYIVMLDGKTFKKEADFLHVKDGIMCLYERPQWGTAQPWITASFSPPAQVWEVEDDES